MPAEAWRSAVVGQAQGILVERHTITTDAAYRMLIVGARSLVDRRLREIAADLLPTGDLTEEIGQPTTRAVFRLGTSPG